MSRSKKYVWLKKVPVHPKRARIYAAVPINKTYPQDYYFTIFDSDDDYYYSDDDSDYHYDTRLDILSLLKKMPLNTMISGINFIIDNFIKAMSFVLVELESCLCPQSLRGFAFSCVRLLSLAWAAYCGSHFGEALAGAYLLPMLPAVTPGLLLSIGSLVGAAVGLAVSYWVIYKVIREHTRQQFKPPRSPVSDFGSESEKSEHFARRRF